jgi:hypothetical protein
MLCPIALDGTGDTMEAKSCLAEVAKIKPCRPKKAA